VRKNKPKIPTILRWVFDFLNCIFYALLDK
jgi:hypothetical protein